MFSDVKRVRKGCSVTRNVKNAPEEDDVIWSQPMTQKMMLWETHKNSSEKVASFHHTDSKNSSVNYAPTTHIRRHNVHLCFLTSILSIANKHHACWYSYLAIANTILLVKWIKYVSTNTLKKTEKKNQNSSQNKLPYDTQKSCQRNDDGSRIN